MESTRRTALNLKFEFESEFKIFEFFYILAFSTKSLIKFFSSVQITPQPLHNCPEFDILIWKWILKCLNFKIVVLNWKSFFFFF